MSEFRAKTRLYKVYHIHLKGNDDIREGYVGVTRRSLPYRLGQHFNSDKPVGKILRQLGRDAVEITQLAMLNKEEALELEYDCRPERNIGWNALAGGGRPSVVCPGCGKYLPKRKLGTWCGECNPRQFYKGQIPHNYGCGEKYILTDPEGNEYRPRAFTKFCREHDLTPQNLRLVAKGERRHHKGWTARKAA